MKKTTLLLTLMSAMIIACSCTTKPQETQNPFFVEWDTPFGVPPFDKILPEHFMPAFEAAMATELIEIDSIVNNTAEPTFENVIVALDNSGELLSQVSGVFGPLVSAEKTDDLKAILGEISPLLARHGNKISLNDKLFAKINAVYEKRESLGLDSIQMRLLEKKYKGFVRAGVSLDPENKEKLKKINEELSALNVKFGNNLLSDNQDYYLELEEKDLEGLPENLKESGASAAKEKGLDGKYVYNMDMGTVNSFLTYSSNRDMREKFKTMYLDRCNHDDATDNKQLINDYARLRLERAKLLGFNTYAEYVIDNVVAKTPTNAYALLNDLWKPALNSAKAELAEMVTIKKAETGDADFASWDWWYYAEKVRKSKYDLDETLASQYLSAENVRQGIFELSNKLYGITFQPLQAPVYHKDCKVYEVLDADGSHLAVLYLDLYKRPLKKQGAWCGQFRNQSYKNGVKVAPVVYIVCNFPAPVGETPSLLSLDNTETFFHEFGHALHNFFRDVKYKGLSGVERDFVELPSQIMENWAFEPQLLKSYATHYATGQIIPDELIAKINNSSLFNKGYATVENLAACYIDLDIHNLKEYTPMDVNAFEKEMLNVKRGLIPQIPPRYRYPYFSHIFDGGYSAGYYSYKWAEVLDKDAFQAFVDSGDIFNKEIAAAFRKHILSQGGSSDGMVMYHNFRGQDPSREPLLRANGLIK